MASKSKQNSQYESCPRSVGPKRRRIRAILGLSARRSLQLDIVFSLSVVTFDTVHIAWILPLDHTVSVHDEHNGFNPTTKHTKKGLVSRYCGFVLKVTVFSVPDFELHLSPSKFN
jgi:hypothetical protein